MAKVAPVAMRIEHVPVGELSIPSDPRMAACGYRVTYQLTSKEFPHNAALTFELQLQSPPAIQVADLGSFLLGYLEGLLHNSSDEEGSQKRSRNAGFAAVRPIP